MNKPIPPTNQGIPITINHNVTVHIVRPVKPITQTPKLSFRTVGAAAVSCALIASEALPFIDNVHANGILHGLVNFFEQH